MGIAIDVAREAMEKASVVVGEINTKIPETFGDTFIHVSDFDMMVDSTDDPIYFSRWPRESVFDKVAANVASVIDNGSYISFSIGPLFDALSHQLSAKRDLGIHSPFITDSLMDLMKSGAVSNRNKEI